MHILFLNVGTLKLTEQLFILFRRFVTVPKSQQSEERVEEAVEIKEEDGNEEEEEEEEEETTKSEAIETDSPSSEKDESEAGIV